MTRRLILTALDDNHDFWYEQLIPFLISLERTDYKGDIGLISYGVSADKIKVLQENGILVFDAPYRYSAIYIDRQWAVAEIAEKYQYDQVALYDCDIWFPSKKLTIFEQIQENEKLYCAYDVSYASFIENSVKSPTKEIIKPKIEAQLRKHKHLWQVGLLLGTAAAWRNYQQYLDTLLKNSDYIIGYGIDSLATVLYSEETNNIKPISQKYNCIPICGNLKISNLNNGMVLDQEIITFNGELVEGVHLVTQFRSFGVNIYTYSFWDSDFFNAGKKYQANRSENVEYSFHIEDDPVLVSELYAPFRITYLKSNSFPEIKQQDDLVITLGSESVLVLQNTSNIPVTLQCAIQSQINYRKPAIFAVICNNQTSIPKENLWSTFTVNPNEYIQFIARDVDNERAKASWLMNKVKLVN